MNDRQDDTADRIEALEQSPDRLAARVENADDPDGEAFPRDSASRGFY